MLLAREKLQSQRPGSHRQDRLLRPRDNTLPGIMARGTKTCQGMNEWHVEDETGARISLRTVRDRAVDAGLL